MNRVGVISDVHGNSYALEAVLQGAVKLGIQSFLVLGDLVGYYHHPRRVLELLSSFDVLAIKGNHEDILNEYIKGDPEFRSDIDNKYGLGHAYAARDLTVEAIQQMTGLPDSKSVSLANNFEVLLTHGSPRNKSEYVYPDAERQTLESLENVRYRMIFMGHTHYPMVFNGNHSQLINPGSVGQSRLQGGVANWGYIDVSQEQFVGVRTPYDVSPLLSELSQMHAPEYLSSILERENKI